MNFVYNEDLSGHSVLNHNFPPWSILITNL